MPDVHDLEQHRSALTGHCYRMLGSIVEADDAVQETMIRAWKAIEGFDGRSSLRTWLTRIATNVCLDAISDQKRRARPMEEGPAGTIDDELTTKPRTHWLEPVPDARAVPGDEDPAHRTILKESIRLAFVTALQLLPPKQRAALLLSEVLGWSANEVADSLDLSVASVNSALQRARATLQSRGVKPEMVPSELGGRGLSDVQASLVARYVDAFERYDVAALTSLCREDATFSMPPFSLWLQGRASIAGWLNGRGAGCRGSKLVATAANGSPAFGQYKPTPAGGHHAWGIIVLELSEDGTAIQKWNTFLDVEVLFPKFGLPLDLPA